MRSVGVRELEQNASNVVAEAAVGEEVTITVRGRAVARSVPLASTGLEHLVATGRVRVPTHRLSELPRTLAVAPHPDATVPGPQTQPGHHMRVAGDGG